MANLLNDKKVKMSLVGLDRNAFVLMGKFQAVARQQGWTQKEIDIVLKECQTGDMTIYYKLYWLTPKKVKFRKGLNAPLYKLATYALMRKADFLTLRLRFQHKTHTHEKINEISSKSKGDISISFGSVRNFYGCNCSSLILN